MMLNAPASQHQLLLDARGADAPPVEMFTAGAPPPAAVIEGIEGLGFDVTHVYGARLLASSSPPPRRLL